MVKDYLSHHRGKDGLEKDIDFHNSRLWKRKKYHNQVDKDQKKKQYKEYKKIAAIQAEEDSKNIDEKQKNIHQIQEYFSNGCESKLTHLDQKI